MEATKVRTLALAFAALLAMGATTFAEEDELLAQVLSHVARVEAQIPRWQSAANQYQLLSAIVFALGLAISALQLLTRKWTKTAVAAIGLAISGLTGWLEKGFPGDHRAYRASVLEAQDTLQKLGTQIAFYRQDPDLATIRDKLQFLKENVEPLEARLTGIEKTLVASVSPQLWVPAPFRTEVAFAQGVDAGRPFTVQGMGECTSLSQARENSGQAAVDKLVSLVAQRLKRPVSSADRDLLRQYVADYATRTQAQLRGAAGQSRVQTTLTLAPTYAASYALEASLKEGRAGLGAQPTPEEQIRSIRQRFAKGASTTDVDGFLETTVKLQPGSTTVPLRATNAKNGSFRFGLSVTTDRGAGARVSLESVEIHQDASGGSTRWRFDLLDRQGNRILAIPTQRWDDSGRPTKCSFDPGAGYAGATQFAGTVEVTLVGLKPKVK
jgi:hypothetical protein